MFKKKPNIKPLAPLRSSDRRKLADQVIKAYGLSLPAIAEDATDDIRAAATARQTELRNSLFPDNVQSARFTTTQGPELKQVSGTVYIGSSSSSSSSDHSDGISDDVRILWFKLDDTLYPSVYTLWRNPCLIPLLHTPELVVKKLRDGADLMTPGLGGGPPFLEAATKGATVAVSSLEAGHVPVVVGRCLIDVAALQSTRDLKGHAVQTLHWAGDELWAYSPLPGRSGRPVPIELEGWRRGLLGSAGVDDDDDDDDDDAGVHAGDMSGLKLQDEGEGGRVPHGGSAAAERTRRDDDGQEDDGDPERKPLTVKEIDDIFHNAFLYGLHQTRNKLNYPVTQSFVMSNLIQPFLPTRTAEDTKQLQIKNTSFKNVKKFLKSLEKTKLLRLKEKQTETWIVDVDFDDQQIITFKPYSLPPKNDACGGGGGGGGSAQQTNNESIKSRAEAGADPSIGQTLKMFHFYKAPERLMPVLADAEPAPQSQQLYTAASIKAAINSYMVREGLVSDNDSNKRLVRLDATLASALFNDSHGPDSQALQRGTAARDAIIERVMAACSPWHQLQVSRASGALAAPTKTAASAAARAGAPPSIKMTLETRSGNKTVTRISGLERFHISAPLLADELRRSCAGATSVEPLAGASPKEKERLMEVMVQGPQRDAVLKALERRGVNVGRWVVVEDKVKRKR